MIVHRWIANIIFICLVIPFLNPHCKDTCRDLQFNIYWWSDSHIRSYEIFSHRVSIENNIKHAKACTCNGCLLVTGLPMTVFPMTVPIWLVCRAKNFLRIDSDSIHIDSMSNNILNVFLNAKNRRIICHLVSMGDFLRPNYSSYAYISSYCYQFSKRCLNFSALGILAKYFTKAS